MDDFILRFNALLSVLLGGGIAYAVLSRHVHDGIIIKAGLIFMALGLLSKVGPLYDAQTTQANFIGLSRANLLVHIGMAVAAAGYVRRKHVGERNRRRVTDSPLLTSKGTL